MVGAVSLGGVGGLGAPVIDASRALHHDDSGDCGPDEGGQQYQENQGGFERKAAAIQFFDAHGTLLTCEGGSSVRVRADGRRTGSPACPLIRIRIS
jgi:hypothetical protein